MIVGFQKIVDEYKRRHADTARQIVAWVLSLLLVAVPVHFAHGAITVELLNGRSGSMLLLAMSASGLGVLLKRMAEHERLRRPIFHVTFIVAYFAIAIAGAASYARAGDALEGPLRARAAENRNATGDARGERPSFVVEPHREVGGSANVLLFGVLLLLMFADQILLAGKDVRLRGNSEGEASRGRATSEAASNDTQSSAPDGTLERGRGETDG